MDTNKEAYILRNFPQYDVNKSFGEKRKNEWTPKKINAA